MPTYNFASYAGGPQDVRYAIKPNPPKDGDGKPRILVSSATFDRPKDPKIAGLPQLVQRL